MKVISSKEYALNVEDVIWGEISIAVGRAYSEIARTYGFDGEFPVDSVVDAYDDMAGAEVRDMVIEVFEQYGMDIESDGKEW